MSSLNLPDFDALWDYSHPDKTESGFRELLPQFPEDNPATLELLPQVASAQGLQRKFEEAQTTLDRVVEMFEKDGWKDPRRTVGHAR
jgi:hypothetical protein